MSDFPRPLGPLFRKSPRNYAGVVKRDLPHSSVHILSHTLVEFSLWNLRRVSDIFWRLYIPLSDGAFVRQGKRSIPLRPGFLTLISPHTTLATVSEKPFSMWLIHFQLTDTIPGPGHPPFPEADTLCEIEITPELLVILEKACPTYNPAEPQAPAIPLLAASELITHTLRSQPTHTWRINIRDTRVPALLELAKKNLHKHGVLDILREAVGMDKSQLYRLFLSETGFPPMHFVTEMRLDRATDLLQKTSLSFMEIAATCGLSNTLRMNRMLKKHRQTTAPQIRKQVIL